MSQEINKDILVALKALLWIRDNPNGLTYGITLPVEEFARQVIERAEFRAPNTDVKTNGVSKGWYDDVKNGEAPHPLSLMAAACDNLGKPHVFGDYDIEPADLDAYFERTALGDIAPAATGPSSPKP